MGGSGLPVFMKCGALTHAKQFLNLFIKARESNSPTAACTFKIQGTKICFGFSFFEYIKSFVLKRGALRCHCSVKKRKGLLGREPFLTC